MHANLREHGYGDLREAVIDVMLEAGEAGLESLDRLLEKTAHELGKRDGPEAGRQRLSRGPAHKLHPNDAELALEIVWDLVRQGIVTFGFNASDPARPWLRRSRFGERALSQGPHPFHNNTGLLRALRWEAADVSPDSVIYLREAVTAFYMDCLLSSCVMLGVAAENEFLRLLSVARNSKAYGRYFARIGDGLSIAAKISQFREAIKPIEGLLPKSATDELDLNLKTIQSVIRAARSEPGQSRVLPPSRDQMYLDLQLFIPFAKQAMRLRQELKAPAYPRLVRA